MKAYFKLELKKNIFSLRTVISILIILGTFMITYLEEIRFPYPGLDGVDYFIRIHQFSYISFVGPVVAGAIYSTSIIKDNESEFTSKLLEIIDKNTYFKTKFAVNAIINSFVIVVSYGIFILYLIINYGVSNDNVANINNGAFVMHAFIGVYQISKIAYAIIIFLATAMSSVAFSTFMLGIVTATRKKFIAYIFPIFYVILTGIFFEMFLLNSLIDFNVIKLFDLTTNNLMNDLGVVVYDLILTLLGMGILYRVCYNRNVNLISE